MKLKRGKASALSDKKTEKQRLELEEHNGLIDPEHENIIIDIIVKMNKWFGKTKVDETTDSWRSYIKLKRLNSENIDKFPLRYETS